MLFIFEGEKKIMLQRLLQCKPFSSKSEGLLSCSLIILACISVALSKEEPCGELGILEPLSFHEICILAFDDIYATTWVSCLTRWSFSNNWIFPYCRICGASHFGVVAVLRNLSSPLAPTIWKHVICVWVILLRIIVQLGMRLESIFDQIIGVVMGC